MEQRITMMRRWTGRLAAVAVCGLGLLSGGSADAALVIRVTYNGTDFDFPAAGGGDSVTLSQDELNDLNAALLADGAQFEFDNLSASSTSPIGNPGALTQDATIRVFGSNTLDTVTVTATDTDYITALPTFRMDSVTNTVFTSVDSSTGTEFTSFFNPSNTEFATDEAGTTLTTQSAGGIGNNQDGDDATDGISADTEYGLTNVNVITLGAVEEGATDGFVQAQGSTVVIGAVIPEPATVALLVGGLLPLGAARVLRRRKV